MANALAQVTKACESIDSVRAQAAAEINRMRSRFDAARRTVQLLAGAARMVAIPPIPSIPNLAELDLGTYNRLRSACPILGLPSVDASSIGQLPGIAQLEKLRSLVQGSVGNAIDRLERSPLGLIDQLESSMDRELNKLLNKLAPLDGILGCACTAADLIANPDFASAQNTWTSMKNAKESWSVTSGDFSKELSALREAKQNASSIISI